MRSTARGGISGFSGVIAIVVLLAGCAGQRPVERASYDFTGGDASQVARPPALAIRLEVKMAAWLDTTDMAYRLADDAPHRLRHYADSRWAAKAGLLAAERLQAMVGPAASTARCTLRVEIAEFAQHFDNASASRFVVDARWSIANTRGERLHADARSFAVAATTADARGGVGAAASAIGQLGTAILTAAHSQAECR